MMLSKFSLITCLVAFYYTNGASQTQPDTLKQSIPLTFQNKKISGKYVTVSDTTSTFNQNDYSETISYTYYEVPSEVEKFIATLDDYIERDALLKMYSRRIISYAEKPIQPTIKKL